MAASIKPREMIKGSLKWLKCKNKDNMLAIRAKDIPFGDEAMLQFFLIFDSLTTDG